MIDIIIPTLNAEETLGECLESLARQTVAVRPVIVDGGSTDRTLELARSHDAVILREDREKYVGNSGRANACNVGLKGSNTELVAFLDADVFVPKHWACDLASYLATRNIGAVTSGCVKTGGAIAKVLASSLGSAGSTHGKLFDDVRKVDSVPGYNSMYRREAIDQVGLFNEEIGGCEDWELNHRIREAGWEMLGITRSPVQHEERRNIIEFARQMYGYAWSRARLHRVTKIFTPIHATPTAALLTFIALFVLANTLAGWMFFSYLLFLMFVSFTISIWNFGVITLVFLVQHLAWATGYLAGLLRR